MKTEFKLSLIALSLGMVGCGGGDGGSTPPVIEEENAVTELGTNPEVLEVIDPAVKEIISPEPETVEEISTKPIPESVTIEAVTIETEHELGKAIIEEPVAIREVSDATMMVGSMIVDSKYYLTPEQQTDWEFPIDKTVWFEFRLRRETFEDRYETWKKAAHLYPKDFDEIKVIQRSGPKGGSLKYEIGYPNDNWSFVSANMAGYYEFVLSFTKDGVTTLSEPITATVGDYLPRIIDDGPEYVLDKPLYYMKENTQVAEGVTLMVSAVNSPTLSMTIKNAPGLLPHELPKIEFHGGSLYAKDDDLEDGKFVDISVDLSAYNPPKLIHMDGIIYQGDFFGSGLHGDVTKVEIHNSAIYGKYDDEDNRPAIEFRGWANGSYLTWNHFHNPVEIRSSGHESIEITNNLFTGGDYNDASFLIQDYQGNNTTITGNLFRNKSGYFAFKAEYDVGMVDVKYNYFCTTDENEVLKMIDSNQTNLANKTDVVFSPILTDYLRKDVC